ncbi:hypothetical protein [Rubrivirga sp. IMCC45206]|uniref:hypothetical protein n=1 Tax=Rubrivirga sp. IMCC45206 TaxID=3391614 RepID=UPI00398F918A
MTDRPDDTPADDPLADDPELSKDEAPQAMHLFTEPTEPDEKLDPNLAAFDRVQSAKKVDEEYQAEYNRRYVKEHGDHHGNEPGVGEDI